MSSRETFLRVILPSLAIGVTYGLFLVPEDTRPKLGEKVAKARGRAPLASQQRVKPAEVRELEQEHTALETKLTLLRGGGDDRARMSALRDVVHAFAAHDVLLLDEVEGGGEGFKLPVVLGRMQQAKTKRARKAQQSAQPARHLSQLRLRGTYLAVLHTLEELADDEDSAALIVGVDLDQTDASGQHLWTVVVWV